MSNTGFQQAITLIGSLGAGAALMYVLDPDKGRRRRAIVRDKLLHSVKETESALGKASRDLSNRTRGVLARAESRIRNEFAPDEVLQARVRAQMGHVISHPHAISVSVKEGRVILRGPVLACEVEHLLGLALSVPGVSEIEDQLEVYAEPGHVPGLQGGRPRRNRSDMLTRECSPAEQLIGVVTGGALMVYGLSRRGVPGAALGMIGAGAMLYSVLNGQHDQRQDADRHRSLHQPFNQNQTRKEKTMADQYRNYGSSRYGRRYDEEDERYNRGREEDRGFMNRAGDEVRSWFGDEDAERRRRRDEMEDERRYGRENYGTFDRFSGREEERRGYGRERGREYGREGFSGGYGSSRGYRSSQEYGSSESERRMYGRDYGRERRGSYGSEYGGGYGGGSYGSSSGEGSDTSGMDYGRYGTSGRDYGRDYESERGYSSSPSSWSYTEMWWVPGPYTGRGPSGWQRSDERITDDLSERLQQHGQIDASNINVSVNNGEVTLSGSVNSRLEKRLAEDIAEGCSGVKEVHNNLRVMKEQNQQLTSSTSQSTQQAQTGQQSSQRTRSTTT